MRKKEQIIFTYVPNIYGLIYLLLAWKNRLWGWILSGKVTFGSEKSSGACSSRAGGSKGPRFEKVILACCKSFFCVYLQSWCLERPHPGKGDFCLPKIVFSLLPELVPWKGEGLKKWFSLADNCFFNHLFAELVPWGGRRLETVIFACRKSFFNLHPELVHWGGQGDWKSDVCLPKIVFPNVQQGFPFHWGSGGWGCVCSTLRSRSQPSATVCVRPIWPSLWRVLQRTRSLLEISALFRVAGVALCDVSACFLTCPKSFCVAGAILLQRFQKMRWIFRGSHSTLETSSVMLCGSHSTSVVSRSHFTLHSLHFTAHTPSTLYTPHLTLYTLLYTLYFTLHTLHSTLYTLFFKLYTLHSTLYTPHSTLYTPHVRYTPQSTLHSALYTLHTTLCTLFFTLHTLQSTLHALHSTLYTLHSTLHTLHFILHTPHFTLHTLHFTIHTPRLTLHTPHCTLYTLHFTLYTLHSTLYTLHFTLYTLYFTLPTPHFALYTLHSILYNPQCTLYTPHTTLYTPHSTLCIPPSTASHSLQCTGMVAGETCTRLSNYSFHKSFLRDCIRVRGLHLVFPSSPRAGALGGVGGLKRCFLLAKNLFSIFLQIWCLGRGRDWKSGFRLPTIVFLTIFLQSWCLGG